MTDLHLTVIGCSAASPRPGGACSSYLVTSGALNVLLDCGPGALSILRQEINPRNLDAIVLSHLHADHTLDLVPLAYGLKYGPPADDERKSREERLALFVPPGGIAFLNGLAAVLESGSDGSAFWSSFDIREYDPNGTLIVGGGGDYLNFKFAPTKHYVPCWAIKVFAPGESAGPVLVYGADSAPVESLREFAHGADLLILEATLSEPETPAPIGHMTPRQAGQLATAAGGVRALLLTHYWGHVPPEQIIAEARAVFQGEVTLATEHAQFDVCRTAP